jgi:PKD repeat protein
MLPIVVIAGQSNAAGRGAVPLVPAYQEHGYNAAFSSVQQLYKVDDGPTDPIVWDFEVGPSSLAPISSGNGIFGVELSMCRRLVANGYAHAMAKMAIGSTSLGVHWLPTGTFPTGTNLFNTFLTFCTDAQTQLGGTISELVWVQGEADATNATHAANYATNLRAFIEAFRVAFPGVPVTINRLHLLNGGAFTSTVRDSQDLVARTVPGVRIFTCDDLPLTGAHFTSTGFMALGERFADAILSGTQSYGIQSGLYSGLRSGIRSSVGPNFPPVASFTTSAAGLTINFTDTSKDVDGTIVAWSWSFGDGGTSTAQNPSHTYAAEGTYSVTLTVRDNRGSTASVTNAANVILWTIDSTSNISAPGSSSEWTNFLNANPTVAFTTPSNVWLFQEASGNLADQVGGKTLTVTGTPLYQQAETGWSRKCIKASGAAANQFASNGTMAAATTSVLMLAFARIVQPVAAHQRMYYGGASSNAFEGIGGSALVRLRTGGNAGNGALSHVGQVRPFVLLHDTTNSVNALYSDIEKKSVTYGARSGTSVQFMFGLSTDTTVDTRFLYAAVWTGSAAEKSDAQIKALLQTLGWTVSGY